jgi:hypothetical protein
LEGCILRPIPEARDQSITISHYGPNVNGGKDSDNSRAIDGPESRTVGP